MDHRAGNVLADLGQYAPTVLSGGHGWVGLRAAGGGLLPHRGYRLLVAHEGRAVVDGQRVAAPCALMLQPGAVGDVQPGALRRFAWVAFAVTGTAVRPVGASLKNWWLSANQPSSMAVWGCELPQVLPPQLVPGLGAGLARICASWWRNRDGLLEANALLALHLARIVATVRSTPHAPGDQPYARELEPLVQHYLSDLTQAPTVDKLAARLGLSRSGLYRFFAQRGYGQPGMFLARLRIQQAAALLADQALPVHEVARRCGYASAAAFARAFRAYHQCTPRAYRAAMASVV